jgi:hypothetical protein
MMVAIARQRVIDKYIARNNIFIQVESTLSD